MKSSFLGEDFRILTPPLGPDFRIRLYTSGSGIRKSHFSARVAIRKSHPRKEMLEIGDTDTGCLLDFCAGLVGVGKPPKGVRRKEAPDQRTLRIRSMRA